MVDDICQHSLQVQLDKPYSCFEGFWQYDSIFVHQVITVFSHYQHIIIYARILQQPATVSQQCMLIAKATWVGTVDKTTFSDIVSSACQRLAGHGSKDLENQ